MNPNTAREILEQWKQVLADRDYANDCLRNTGPGESPYTQEQKNAWEMRENALANTLLAAMPEIADLLIRNENISKPKRMAYDCVTVKIFSKNSLH